MARRRLLPRRFRRMSLATKCRWLFGIATALIIAAALLVAFQRLEQLTRQLNVSAGRAVAQTELARHIAGDRDHGMAPTLDFDGLRLRPPAVMGLDDVKAADKGSFEARAFERFRTRRERREFTQVDGNVFRFAEPLRFGADCARCHTLASTAMTQATNLSVTTLVPDAEDPELVGLVRVEIPGQIPTVQVILNRVFLVVGGLLAGLTAIVVLSFILSRLILRPVRVLQETAEKVTAGDMNVRAHISSGDEFQRLADTFNRMLLGLKTGSDQLQAANKSLDLQIVRLSEVNVGLNEANRLKNEFLANVSHELRTPLNSILGFADLLKANARPDDAKSARYVANIATSGAHLLELVNDLLDLAKVEAGKLDVRPAPLSIGDLFEGLTGLIRPLAERRRLTIHAQVSPDVPIVRTDAARLQQVLYNLLSNAIKFSPDGETIDLVAARGDAGHVRIVVVDRGPGIDPKDHATIFEKFRQLDAGVTRQHGGTGLGLSISRELTRLLGGVIGVDSAPGNGSTFWLVLPIDGPVERKQEAGSRKQD